MINHKHEVLNFADCAIENVSTSTSVCYLTLKAPITTAADDQFCDIFPSYRKK